MHTLTYKILLYYDCTLYLTLFANSIILMQHSLYYIYIIFDMWNLIESTFSRSAYPGKTFYLSQMRNFLIYKKTGSPKTKAPCEK